VKNGSKADEPRNSASQAGGFKSKTRAAASEINVNELRSGKRDNADSQATSASAPSKSRRRIESGALRSANNATASVPSKSNAPRIGSKAGELNRSARRTAARSALRRSANAPARGRSDGTSNGGNVTALARKINAIVGPRRPIAAGAGTNPFRSLKSSVPASWSGSHAKNVRSERT
jgi:hypothetical protein